jgi:hypothetical protein
LEPFRGAELVPAKLLHKGETTAGRNVLSKPGIVDVPGALEFALGTEENEAGERMFEIDPGRRDSSY